MSYSSIFSSKPTLKPTLNPPQSPSLQDPAASSMETCALSLALRKVAGSQAAHNALLQAHSARMQRHQQLLTKPQHSGVWLLVPRLCMLFMTGPSITCLIVLQVVQTSMAASMRAR